MFGAYRIGANTPTKFPVPTKVREVVEETYYEVRKPYDLAMDTPNMVNGAMRAANFVTGQRDGNALSYYKQGASIGGPWVATPAFMRDEMNRLVGEAQSLGRDIFAAHQSACAIPVGPGFPDGGLRLSDLSNSECGRLNKFINNSWSPFLKELKQLRLDHQHWHQRLWGAYYTEIQEYRKRLIGMRSVAISLGVGVTAPEPKLPPPPAIEELGNFVRTLIYVLIGGVVVWFLFNTVIPMFKGGAAVAA